MIWLVSTDHAWKPPADAAQAAQIFFSPFFLQLYYAVVVQGSWFYWFFFSISPGNESWGNEKFWKCASLKAENGLSLSSGFHRFICQETFVVSGYICKLDESATDCCSIESVQYWDSKEVLVYGQCRLYPSTIHKSWNQRNSMSKQLPCATKWLINNNLHYFFPKGVYAFKKIREKCVSNRMLLASFVIVNKQQPDDWFESWCNKPALEGKH